MASAFFIPDTTTRRRVKKVARPAGVPVDPAAVVDRLYRDFPKDMARLAE